MNAFLPDERLVGFYTKKYHLMSCIYHDEQCLIKTIRVHGFEFTQRACLLTHTIPFSNHSQFQAGHSNRSLAGPLCSPDPLSSPLNSLYFSARQFRPQTTSDPKLKISQNHSPTRKRHPPIRLRSPQRLDNLRKRIMRITIFLIRQNPRISFNKRTQDTPSHTASAGPPTWHLTLYAPFFHWSKTSPPGMRSPQSLRDATSRKDAGVAFWINRMIMIIVGLCTSANRLFVHIENVGHR